MNDDWIDKNEMNHLISGINPKPPQQQRTVSGPVYKDLFFDVQQNPQPQQNLQPQIPTQNPQPYPHPAQPYSNVQQQAPVVENPAQLLVEQQQLPQPSPFTLDVESTDPAERIAQLEIMLAELKQTHPQPTPPPTIEEPSDQLAETKEEPCNKQEPQDSEAFCNDRIPLTVEIDRYFSLKGRLASLAEILRDYLGMEQMMVVDQNGLSLYETNSIETIDGKVGKYLHKMKHVYLADAEDQRKHSSSQLATSAGKWILLVPTNGKGIEGKYTLKCLLPTPLDPPEIYSLIELLNDTMRPANG